MAERPSTSGGLSPHNASDASFRSLAGRRTAKDDMYIRPHSSVRGSYKSYHIPIRDNPASPVESPGDFSPARTFTVRTQTPDSLDSNMGTIAIGMAIGSPSHPPPEFSSPPALRKDWHPQASNMSMSMTRASPESGHREATGQVGQVSAPKHKSGRWKLFGRSKSKRVASSPVSISQPLNLQQPMASRTDFETAPPSNQTIDMGRRNTERRPRESKPIMLRSQTAGSTAVSPAPPSPKESKPPKLLSRMTSTRSSRGERVKKSDISAPVHVSMQVLALPIKPTGNLLDVEIPSIKMERYSVMFGNVLGKPQGSQGPNGQQQPHGSSALLARRQATLDRLKTIDDKIMKEEEEKERTRGRSATSPQPDRSPTFTLSLFPATPSETTNSSSQSPRHRSHTSPSQFPSPSPSSFDPTRARYYLEAVRADARAEAATPESNRALPTEDVPIKFAFGPDHSRLILDSPTDDQVSEEIHLTEQLKPTIYEPDWKIITPSDSTAPSSTAPSAKDHSPASVASAYTHVTKPSLDGSEPDDALSVAVEISIARQISISRQQRQMLRPLKTQATRTQANRTQVNRTGGSPRGRSPVNVNTVSIGRNERLSSTKSSTPTLISHGATFEQQIAQNRKSERIIVEGD